MRSPKSSPIKPRGPSCSHTPKRISLGFTIVFCLISFAISRKTCLLQPSQTKIDGQPYGYLLDSFRGSMNSKTSYLWVEPTSVFVNSTDLHEFGEVILISPIANNTIGSSRRALEKDLPLLSRNRKRIELNYFAAMNKSGLTEEASRVANWNWEAGERPPVLIYRRQPQRHPKFSSYLPWWLEKSRNNWFLGDIVVVYENFFREQEKGFFIEVGGNTGREGDSMAWIFRKKGWDGIAIEAAPLLYSQLHTEHAEEGLTTMEGALCEKFSVVEFLGSTGCCAGIKSKMSEQHINSFQLKESPVSKVNCIPLNAVLRALDVKVVDFFSLDVEGAELDVLKSIDWSTVHIRSILVEIGRDKKSDEEIRALLRKQNFTKFAFDSVSDPALNELWIQQSSLLKLPQPPSSKYAFMQDRVGCSNKCHVCGEGSAEDGGVALVEFPDGTMVCNEHCSPGGYCGTTRGYLKGNSCQKCVELVSMHGVEYFWPPPKTAE